MNLAQKMTLISCLPLIALFISCQSGSSGSEVKDRAEVTPAHSVVDGESEDPHASPPESWKEHWFDHNQVLKLVYHNDDLAVYFDDDVDPSVDWPNTYLSQVWSYVKSVYGDFGEDPKLYAIFHTDKYSGGHPGLYLDQNHDYRNVVDCGPYDWKEMKPEAGLNMVIHEIGHIVEGATNGIKHNPAWNIWKDSKWAEIFIYDVYKNTGQEAFAKQLYDELMNQYDDFPTKNTQWFKNWFYPIYSDYGESEVLKGFYDLLALHFPKNNAGDAFSRRMNMGEFVHFWSGAAGSDLQPLAKEAFGWTTQWEEQLLKAKNDFNALPY